MSAPPIEAHTAALLTRLATTGLPVGDARKPDDAGWQGTPGASSFLTYLVLYPVDVLRAGPDAALDDNYRAPHLTYQVTSVGQDRRAAQVGADLAATCLTDGTPLGIPGWSTERIRHDSSAGVTRDEDVNPPLYYAIDRYLLEVSTP